MLLVVRDAVNRPSLSIAVQRRLLDVPPVMAAAPVSDEVRQGESPIAASHCTIDFYILYVLRDRAAKPTIAFG